MTWHNPWGTVKCPTAKSCALYFEVSNVGKTIESSKKRVTWRIRVEEGNEFEVQLTHSIASGKKVVRVDGIVKHSSSSIPFGDWDYVLNLPGGHVVHLVIKPCVDLNDMYDLIIDNISFRRLPDRLDEKRNKAQPIAGKPPAESSFNPWECPVCTLMNDKPHAPVCEACGSPRPNVMSPASAARVRAATEKSTSSGSQACATLFNTDDVFAPFGSTNVLQLSHTSTTPPVSFDAPAPALQFENVTSMLSDIDFNATPSMPTNPVPPPLFQDFTRPPEPTPQEMPESQPAGNGDLWESKMVDLNLKREEELGSRRSLSIRAQPTLEQARQTTTQKEKMPVMPLPAQPRMTTAPPAVNPAYFATSTPAMVAGGGMYPQFATTSAPNGAVGFGNPGQGFSNVSQGYNQQTQSFHMAGGYPTVGGGMQSYGTVGGAGMGMGMGMNMNMNMGAPQTQCYMTGVPQYGTQQNAKFGGDPFATLS